MLLTPCTFDGLLSTHALILGMLPTLYQVSNLRIVFINSLVSHQLHVCHVKEEVEVSPGESIAHHELSPPALQLLLQLPHGGGDVCLQELLLSGRVLGMVE